MDYTTNAGDNSPAGFQQRSVSFAGKAGIWSALRVSGLSLPVGLTFAAADAANQLKGERLPTLAGRSMGLATMPAMSAAFASGLMLVPGIGPVAAGVLAPIAALYPNAMFRDSLARGFRKMSQFGRDVRHLEMGGTFKDSLSARASRDSALQEMNGSMVASRRWLGQEAAMLHR